VRRTLVPLALAVAIVVLVGVAAILLRRAERPAADREDVEMKSTPGVVAAIRDVARLETTSYHVEKVVQATDVQAHLWGLLQAKDDLLLVAVGDVVAGVDLGKVRDEDVRIDPQSHAVHVVLPPPEVISSSLDAQATHVYSRRTDALAVRNEQLEGDARRSAEDEMRKRALDAGILDRARTNADRTLRALLRSLGFSRVDLDWQDRG
jgi:hypothetical protein